MPYFTIMAELRGCYADNESAFTIKANTRKELKNALMSERVDLVDAGAIGLAKDKVTSLAATVWRNAKTKHGKPVYPFVLPFKYPHQSGYAMGLFVYISDRKTYLAQMED